MNGDNHTLTPEEIIMRLFFLAMKTRATLFFLSYLGYIIHVLFVQSFIVQNYLFIYSISHLLPIHWYIVYSVIQNNIVQYSLESALHSIWSSDCLEIRVKDCPLIRSILTYCQNRSRYILTI